MSSSSVQEWREKRRQGVEVQLPQYGDLVRLKPLDAAFFFKTGKVPDFLAPTVQKLINGKTRGLIDAPDKEQQKTQEWLTFLDELMLSAFADPKVVNKPASACAEDEISVSEIEYIDKLFIYRWFGQPAETMRRFRQFQIKSVASVDAAKNNGTGSEQVAERAAVVEPDAGHEG